MSADPVGYVARPRYLVHSKDAIGSLAGAVPAGLVDGMSGVNKFGENSALGTSSIETIWDGSSDYNTTPGWPGSGLITHAWSLVNSVATQGLVIEVQGLNNAFVQVTDTVTLDGTNSTTAVAFDNATAFRRVFRMKVIDSTTADQNIQCGDGAKANYYAQITAGYNQTLMALYTVPAGKSALLTKYYASLNRAAGGGSTIGVKIRLWAQDNANGYAPQLKHVRGLDSAANSQFDYEFNPWFKVTEKTDIFLQAENLSGSITGDLTGGFDLFLYDN